MKERGNLPLNDDGCLPGYAGRKRGIRIELGDTITAIGFGPEAEPGDEPPSEEDFTKSIELGRWILRYGRKESERK